MSIAEDWRDRFPETLERVGRALYGDAWRAALARALPGTDHPDSEKHRLRMLERWYAGQRQPRSSDVFSELVEVAERRAAELEAQAKAARSEAGRLAREAAAIRASESAATRPRAGTGTPP